MASWGTIHGRVGLGGLELSGGGRRSLSPEGVGGVTLGGDLGAGGWGGREMDQVTPQGSLSHPHPPNPQAERSHSPGDFPQLESSSSFRGVPPVGAAWGPEWL